MGWWWDGEEPESSNSRKLKSRIEEEKLWSEPERAGTTAVGEATLLKVRGRRHSASFFSDLLLPAADPSQ